MRDTSDKGETPKYLHDMTDAELLRFALTLKTVTPLENELLQRFQIMGSIIDTLGDAAL
jgi:hypothetical protein